LKKRHRQQSLDGLPLEESPSETVSGEDEDNGDDDVGSWYDSMTYLAHLPDVRPLLEPIGGLTSWASREASGPIEGEGEPGERRTGVGRWRRSREPDRLGLSRRLEQWRRRQKPGHHRWV
jgi:hypothetical protein